MIVVSDTSPLRALDHLGLLGVLQILYGEVLIPPSVESELTNPQSRHRPVLTSSIPGLQVRSPTDAALVQSFRPKLDLGEAEAIVLAIEASPEVLLIDEIAGRAEAQRRGIPLTRTLGILIRAKHEGHIPAVAPLIDDLRNTLGFFVSDSLRAKALRLAGE